MTKGRRARKKRRWGEKKMFVGQTNKSTDRHTNEQKKKSNNNVIILLRDL